MKSLANILDATASNRSMWKTKDSEYIIFMDIEKALEIKPDLIRDCRDTGFPNESIGTIFYDPPHWWGDKTGNTFWTCRNKLEDIAFRKRVNSKPRGYTYYGTDKYKTKTQLLRFIYDSQKEFYRILKRDGILWLIWSEVKLPLSKIIVFFKDWFEMIRLPISSPLQSMGKNQNYWVMFMKRPLTHKQTEITLA